MAGLWAALAALIAVVGTVTGVLITQQSERNRQAAAQRQSETEWSRDRRLDAYNGFVRSVSLRVSALSGLRENLEGEGYPTAKWHADSALAEMWIGVREVRLVGPENVTKLAEQLARHYDDVDAGGYPRAGSGIGARIEDEFGQAARAAIAISGGGVQPGSTVDSVSTPATMTKAT